LALAVGALALPVAVSAGEAELSGIEAYGRDIYQGRCSNCHSNEPGQSSLAPTLHGLMGRKAGGVEGFPYSEKISRLDLVWSPETLKVWLASQSLDSALLRMRHLGVADPGDADALIAYIVTLK
jgi:cytochrome c